MARDSNTRDPLVRISNRPVISEGVRSRQGWEQAFRAAGSAINDELLLEITEPNGFDDKEWTW